MWSQLVLPESLVAPGFVWLAAMVELEPVASESIADGRRRAYSPDTGFVERPGVFVEELEDA